MKNTKLTYPFLLSCFLSIFMFTESIAQPFVGHKYLRTQAEIVTFGASFTSVTGLLVIEESTPGDITDLTPLSTIISVGEYLDVINNTALTNLNGLEGITSIIGDLNVHDNPSLTNIDGITNFTSIGGDLQLRNLAITNIDGLNNLTAIGGDLIVIGNAFLTNIDGLNNLSAIGEDFDLMDNASLTNIDGLKNLTTIAGEYVYITDNTALTNLDGLSNLTSVADYLTIDDNSALTNLDGLSNLTFVGGRLQITNNTALTQFCGIFPLLNAGGLVGTYDVSGNLTNPTMAEIIAGGTCAAPCIGDITLTTQAEVDAFSCVAITGNLTIQESVPGNITNLTPLSTLKSVDGNLFVYKNTALTNLDGLSNITSVSGFLYVYRNSALINLDGLSNITSVGEYLDVSDNSALINLDGLSNITSVGGNLYVSYNPKFTNLDGLNNITSVGKDLYVYGNSALTNLDGLSNITFIGGDLAIYSNSALTNLDGLSNITSVSGKLRIERNPKLTNLSGLEGIISVRQLYINGNAALTSLAGLEGITYIGLTLQIKNNSVLSEFCALFNLINIGGGQDASYEVANNAVNPTGQEIIDAGPCNVIPPAAKTISYKVTLPDCENAPNTLIVTEGEFKEGESFTFPAYQLPTQYAAYQQYYNAFVNAEFGIPEESLIEDIQIIINLEGICENGLIDNPDTKEFLELYFLSVEIIGANSGAHSPFEYYYFENEKEAYLKLMKANLDPIMALLNFDTDQLIPFFTVNGLDPDFEGIRKVIDDTHYTIYARHFSEVKLGVQSSITDVDGFVNEVPSEYGLNQNYPNPFNPSTSISYSIPENGHVTLAIYDVLGNSVEVLENGYKSAGSYSQSFDASNLTSGIYFYTIRSGKFLETKKMLLMK